MYTEYNYKYMCIKEILKTNMVSLLYSYKSTIKILLYNYKYMSIVEILKTNIISLNEFRSRI